MSRTLTVPLFPLPRTVLFPGIRLPLYVFEARYRTMLEDVLDGPGLLGVPMLLPGFDGSLGDRRPFAPVFGVGRVQEYVKHEDGTSHVQVLGEHRVRLLEELPGRAYRRARVRVLGADEDAGAGEPFEVDDSLRESLRRIVKLAPGGEAGDHLRKVLEDSRVDAHLLVNLMSTVVVGNAQVRQNLLEVPHVSERARYLLDIVETLIQELDPDVHGDEEQPSD